MKKIICIGECSLNIILNDAGRPRGSVFGGRIANAATILSRQGIKVLMASDVCADALGDIIVDRLTRAGVDVTSVDRFTEGRSAVNLFVEDSEGNITPQGLIRYEEYPEQAFDIIWPRIDEDDIVLFGGYYAIDPRVYPGLNKLLAYAKERKAILIYLPGFLPQQQSRITRVMPQLLENFELADVMITRNKDLELLFGAKTPDVCYHNHIDFYCRSLVNVDAQGGRICYYSGKEVSSVEIPGEIARTMMWNAGAVAGIVAAIHKAGLNASQFDTPGSDIREKLLDEAATVALAAASDISEKWQNIE